jgi:hypothetical protein
LPETVREMMKFNFQKEIKTEAETANSVTRSFVFFVAQVGDFFQKKSPNALKVPKYLHESRSETSKDQHKLSF